MNCKFDPFLSLEALGLMKEALDKKGLSCYLTIQPVGYHTPDAGRTGFSSLPECPFGKQPPDFPNSFDRFERALFFSAERKVGNLCTFRT